VSPFGDTLSFGKEGVPNVIGKEGVPNVTNVAFTEADEKIFL